MSKKLRNEYVLGSKQNKILKSNETVFFAVSYFLSRLIQVL